MFGRRKKKQINDEWTKKTREVFNLAGVRSFENTYGPREGCLEVYATDKNDERLIIESVVKIGTESAYNIAVHICKTIKSGEWRYGWKAVTSTTITLVERDIEEKHQCEAMISMQWQGSCQCVFAASVERDGKWYCSEHDPMKKHRPRGGDL